MLDDLKDKIDILLGLSAVKQLLQLNSNTIERAYEAYIFSLCVDAVRRAGGTATLRGILSGPNPATVIFRGGPGSMASHGADYVYALCTLGVHRFEIHVDVQYQGSSTVSHEIDVSVCDHDHAEDVRQIGLSPRANKNLIMAFECKFYSATVPGVALGRTFVGLVQDCTGYRFCAFTSNRTSRNLQSYLGLKHRPDPFLGLNPTDSHSEERFIHTVEQSLRKWAKV